MSTARIAALEERIRKLEQFIAKDCWSWGNLDDILENETLSSFINDEVSHNMHIDGPVTGLNIERNR